MPPPPMHLETVPLEHLPATHSVHVALFRNVANADFLHAQLLGRNAAFEYALVDATALASRLHLLAAVYKAVALGLAGALKTPNVHSEIVCALSSNNNISEAYRRYGIQPSTKDVAVVKVLVKADDNNETPDGSSQTPSDAAAHLAANVQGESVPFSDAELARTTDWARLRKYHKLNGVAWVDAIKDDGARRRELEMLVLSGMALRGV